MGKNKRRAGWSLIVLGVALMASQVATLTPWQAGIALGILMVVVGGVLVADLPYDKEDEWASTSSRTPG